MDIREKESSGKSERKNKSLPPIRLQDIGLPKLLLVAAAGVALLVLSIPSGYRGSSTGSSGQGNTGTGEEAATAMEAYTDKKEKQLEKILQKVAGIGQVEVMITLDSAEEKSRLMESTRVQKVEGVLVVAEGAGDAQTDAEIIRAVQALFSLESHKIRVMKME
ncbi:MAG: hypothetical protein K2J67_02805 [Lachnospiraceae bacterium]|nr:hypothetical protein [Lachnospiraceae bacterium]